MLCYKYRSRLFSSIRSSGNTRVDFILYVTGIYTIRMTKVAMKIKITVEGSSTFQTVHTTKMP